jgi:hypothetical protein
VINDRYLLRVGAVQTRLLRCRFFKFFYCANVGVFSSKLGDLS